jgi:hypothetical protein
MVNWVAAVRLVTVVQFVPPVVVNGKDEKLFRKEVIWSTPVTTLPSVSCTQMNPASHWQPFPQ